MMELAKICSCMNEAADLVAGGGDHDCVEHGGRA